MKRKPVSKKSKIWASSGFVPKPESSVARPLGIAPGADMHEAWTATMRLLSRLSMTEEFQGKERIKKYQEECIQVSRQELLPDVRLISLTHTKLKPRHIKRLEDL